MNEKDTLLDDYIAIVSQFCSLLANMAAVNAKIQEQAKIDPDYVSELSDKISRYQKALLVVKKRLGYTDGLSFLDDCKFRGFSIHDGKFDGTAENLVRFVTPWVDEFPSSSTNNYKFEVGSLLIALAHEHIQ